MLFACAGIIPAVGPALAQDSKRGKRFHLFAAHEDDWQLFMNPSAFEDVVSGAAKTVFVHLTAGDAGTPGAPGRHNFADFYLARLENGAEAAIFMANANSAPASVLSCP